MEIVIPKHNDDPAKIILTAKAKDSPYVNTWYKESRKAFIDFVKAFNSKSLPDWTYRDKQKTRLAKLRQLWTNFQELYPYLGIEEDPEHPGNILKIIADIDITSGPFDSPLKTCEIWMTYSKRVKGLRVKIEDYCCDNMYFKMRKAGQLRLPEEPPREQQKMMFYSDSHDPTSPMFGFHPGFR